MTTLLLSCKEETVDTSKIHSQKYVDSTLNSIRDSLDKAMQNYYDSLIQAEAEYLVDSLLQNTNHKKETEMDLKIPKPSIKNLPEPTGPEYKFPEEES